MSGASRTAQSRQPLDEVMLAMDVVDTLRHQEKVVARELLSDTRDEELKKNSNGFIRHRASKFPSRS